MDFWLLGVRGEEEKNGKWAYNYSLGSENCSRTGLLWYSVMTVLHRASERPEPEQSSGTSTGKVSGFHCDGQLGI